MIGVVWSSTLGAWPWPFAITEARKLRTSGSLFTPPSFSASVSLRKQDSEAFNCQTSSRTQIRLL